MMRRSIAGMAAGLALAACATAPEPEREIHVGVGPDGELVFMVPEGADEEEAAMVAALNQIMTQIDEEDAEPAAQAEPEVLAEEDIWQELEGGHLLHVQSGAICATTMGGIARERELVFAPDGSDVGCNYADAARQQSYMTFYIYHRPHDAATEWQESMAGLTTRHPGAQEVPYGTTSGSYVSTTLLLEGADGATVRSSLLLSEANGWYLKMRVTCPAVECASVEQLAGIGLMGQIDRVRMGDRAPDMERPAPT